MGFLGLSSHLLHICHVCDISQVSLSVAHSLLRMVASRSRYLALCSSLSTPQFLGFHGGSREVREAPITDLLGRAELGLLTSFTMSNIHIVVSRFPFPSFLDSPCVCWFLGPQSFESRLPCVSLFCSMTILRSLFYFRWMLPSGFPFFCGRQDKARTFDRRDHGSGDAVWLGSPKLPSRNRPSHFGLERLQRVSG